MSEQSYIIRIYRCTRRRGSVRRAHDRVTLAGIVESPAGNEHQAFHDIEELWAILADRTVAKPGARRLSVNCTKR